MSEQYKGGVPLTGGIEVKGGGDSFPLVKAHDIYVDETHRLDEKLAELENGGGSGGGGVGDSDLKEIIEAVNMALEEIIALQEALIGTPFDELHEYAQSLKDGGEV